MYLFSIQASTQIKFSVFYNNVYIKLGSFQ